MPFVHRAIQCRVAVARSPGPVGGRVYVEDMSGTSRIDATSTIDARRMGVTAATSLLTRLGEVVVRVGNDQLGPFLREVDDLSRQIDAASGGDPGRGVEPWCGGRTTAPARSAGYANN